MEINIEDIGSDDERVSLECARALFLEQCSGIDLFATYVNTNPNVLVEKRDDVDGVLACHFHCGKHTVSIRIKNYV